MRISDYPAKYVTKAPAGLVTHEKEDATMKRITYRIMTEINRGTEETQDIQQVFHACEIRCPDGQLDANLALA